MREQLAAAVQGPLPLRELFAAWDQDGSGSVNRTEFHHALLVLGVDCTSEEAGAVFKSLDADGSGEVDYRELQRALKPAPAPKATTAPKAP